MRALPGALKGEIHLSIPLRVKAANLSHCPFVTFRKSSAVDKAEQRRHKVLELQFHLAQQKARSSDRPRPSVFGDEAPGPAPPVGSPTGPDQLVSPGAPPLQTSEGVASSGPPAAPPIQPGSGSVLPSSSHRPVPEATFTPTAVGLRPTEGPQPNLPLNVQSIVAETISRILAADSLPSLQPQSVLPPPPVPAPTGWDRRPYYSGY